MESTALKSRSEALRKRCGRLVSNKEHYETELDRLIQYGIKLNQEKEDNINSLDLVRLTAQKTQFVLENSIKAVSNSALKCVFGDKYELGMDFNLKRNSNEIDIYLLEKGTNNRVKPTDACGGGVIDLLSMSLRITMWTLKRPRTRPLLILDEPFKFLSRDLKPLAAEMIKNLSESLKIQMLIVSHEKDIIECSDKVFDLTQNKKGAPNDN
jgi:DNA repair exonuclease SbcCD ATPase subunit